MISDNLQRLQDSNTRIKTNIANAYAKASEKGAALPSLQNSENLASTIESIQQGSSDWQPEPDWWDIDTILEEDTEDYAAKSIWLLNDLSDTFNIQAKMMNADKIKMSDGAEYTYSTSAQTHTWDREKDKECAKDYKTRYVIFYWSDTKYAGACLMNNELQYNILYLIFKNVKFKQTTTVLNFLDRLTLVTECFKYVNCSWDMDFASSLPHGNIKKLLLDITGDTGKSGLPCQFTFNYLSDEEVQALYDRYFNENVTSLYNAFASSNIQKIDLRDTSNVKTWGWTMRNATRLITIKNLNLESANNVNGTFENCYSLRNLEISNIKISGLSFSGCQYLSRDSVLNIKNACYDYSTDTENVHNIAIGAKNIAKLTEEELAEWLQWGWTVS